MKVVTPRRVNAVSGSPDLLGALHGLAYDDIPPELVAKAKLLILDTLAVAWAARESAGMKAVLQTVLADGGTPQSSLWGQSPQHRVPSAAAAFHNSALASALDFDSLHHGGGVHADAVVIPAALAVAEQMDASGADFITAYVAGAELAIRLGLATQSTTGWFRTSTYGIFGAAVAAGKLGLLRQKELSDALGIALGQAAGTQQSHIERALSKRIQGGIAARSGVFAAQLAKAGVTGPQHPLDGTFGLFALYDEGDPAALMTNFGHQFHLLETSFKKYPACNCAHAAIEAALTLAAHNDFDIDDITEVDVTITPYMNRLVGAAYTAEGEAEVVGQFCVQYDVAAALARGRFTTRDLAPEAVFDPMLRPLINKVKITVDESAQTRMIPASVSVTNRAGTRLARSVDSLPGSPELPLSSEAVRIKALDALTKSHPDPKVLIQKIDNLDKAPSVRDLFAGTHSL